MPLRNRIPRLQQIAPVFAVVCMLIYGWTTYRFIQKLPSWLLYLNVQEILSNYSHTLVFNFLEALLITCLVILLNFLLPAKLFMDMFVARASLLAAFGLGYLIFLALAVGQSKLSQFPQELFRWAPLVFAVILLLAIYLPHNLRIRKSVEFFADRAVIFLYVLLPLTALGGLMFLAGNLF